MGANGISRLPTKQERQVAKLNLAASKNGLTYDIDYLPTKYNSNAVAVNTHDSRLLPGRPWIEKIEIALSESGEEMLAPIIQDTGNGSVTINTLTTDTLENAVRPKKPQILSSETEVIVT